MARQTAQPYFEKHRVDLQEILKRYEGLFDQGQLEGMEDPSLVHLLGLESSFRYSFRPYQREALGILNELFGIVQDDRAMKGHSKRRALIEDLLEENNRKKVPYLGFEMATGSGKTLVMAASIQLLAERFGLRNFLVIVGGPASSNIYQKTIRNFSLGHPQCVWEADTGFAFNLVTGENYREGQNNLDFGRIDSLGEQAVNIFVFNIQKFTETSGQTGEKTRRTQKPWETAPWKDKDGNTISLHEYLASNRLVIVTDEAHHTQGKASQDIIKSFDPEAVLEFTATADEIGGGNRRAQDIVYKYDIRRFLDEGYGKLIRALPLDSSKEHNADRDELDDYEKRKLIATLLVHLVKREALGRDPHSRITKAVCLVKVKDSIEAANRVMRYFREEIGFDAANLSWVLQKLVLQKLPILERFEELWEGHYKQDAELLAAELAAIGREAIGVYGDPDKETRAAFDEISSNHVELVVSIKMLDEGIDIANIYTIAVVKDNETDLVTSIKQIIGRGVRLNKETRLYDDARDPWLSQAELLHVVCDRGAAFESIIAAIQSAFGLTERHIVAERPLAANGVNRVKRPLLEKRYWPQLRADLVVREGVRLLDLLGDVDDILADYLDTNCFYKGELGDTAVLKFRPSAFFVEVDIFADPEEYRRQLMDLGARFATLELDERAWKDIYSRCLRQQTTIPDIGPVREFFRSYRRAFSEKSIGYYYLDEADHAQAIRHFAVTFSYFLANYVEKHYYRLDVASLDEDGMRPLVNCFKDEDIFLPSEIAQYWGRAQEDRIAKDMIRAGYPFRGYTNNAYDYVSYDSWPEKLTGDNLNARLDGYLTVKDSRPVWIKNRRQVSFSYGRHQYYPDFLVCVGEKMYVVETKGDPYSDQRKNQLLREVERKTEGKVKAVLAFGDWVEGFGQDAESLEDFITAAEGDASRRLQLWDLEYTPPEMEKYKTYLPVYTPEKAFKKWARGHDGVRCDGWARLDPPWHRVLPQTCFALQNRGKRLAHLGPWLIVDAGRKTPENGENVLLHYAEFDDSYRRGYSVRALHIYPEQTGGIFSQDVWELSREEGEKIMRLRPRKDRVDLIGIVLEHR